MLTATRPQWQRYDLPDDTFTDLLRVAARGHGDEVAIVDGQHHVTYADLLARARHVAGGLRARGVRPGDRVVVQLPNWWETVVTAWGVVLAGAVLVPVVPIYRERELGFVLTQVAPAAVIAPETYRGHPHGATIRALLARLRSTAVLITVRGDPIAPDSFERVLAGDDAEPASVQPDDVAVVLYTSGTSADPKGALHSHRSLLAEVRDIARWCRLRPRRERVFMASPLSHITGLSYGILLPVDLGGAVVLQERWDARAAMTMIEESGCTFTVSATPFLRGLAETYAGHGPASLRTFVCGGADIPESLVREAGRVMGTRVLRTYGSTELPTVTMADPDADPETAARSEGRPMGRNEVRIRPDENGSPELLVRGPELFLGYLDAELNREAFTPDGWFCTGDLADIAADGTVRIVGRIKDVINRGGEKFSAAEVEAVLLGHPAVADVAVVAYPDPVLVERACAFVVPRGDAVPTVAELRATVEAAGLAVQKAPELVLAVAELPRTASGKVQRYLLREQVRRQSGARAQSGSGRG